MNYSRDVEQLTQRADVPVVCALGCVTAISTRSKNLKSISVVMTVVMDRRQTQMLVWGYCDCVWLEPAVTP